MTPQLAVGLSSIAGALLFLATGYLLARIRSAPAELLPQPMTTPSADQAKDDQIASLKEALASAQSNEKELVAQIKDLELQYGALQAMHEEDRRGLRRDEGDEDEEDRDTMAEPNLERMVGQEQELIQAQVDRDSLRAQNVKLQTQLKEAREDSSKLMTRADELQKALNQAHADKSTMRIQVEKLQMALNAARSGTSPADVESEQLQQALNQAHAEKTALNARVEKLSQELIEARSKPSTMETQSEKLQDSLAQNKATKAELQELVGQLKREQAELKKIKVSLDEARHGQGSQASPDQSIASKDKELASSRQALEVLRGELEKLKSEQAQAKLREKNLEQEVALLRERPPTAVKPPPLADPPSPDKPFSASKPESLESIVDMLAQIQGAHGAVLSDDSGLVIAGTGGDNEALAVMASSLREVGARAMDLLPLSSFHCCTIEDRDKMTFCALPFETPSGQLLLATLTKGMKPDRDFIHQVISQASQHFA